MEKPSLQHTVAEVLRDTGTGDEYVEYVRKAYGAMTVEELLGRIEGTKPIGCFNRHELENSPFTKCPDHEGNNTCSHQLETEVRETEDDDPVIHRHATGMYRAGLYVLATAGAQASTADGTPITHELVMQGAADAASPDHGCYLEFSRFNGHPMRVPLEEREEERIPQLCAATSLPVLKQAINKLKAPCGQRMNAICAGIASRMRETFT